MAESIFTMKTGSFLAQINPNSFSQVVTAPEYDEQVRTYHLTVSNSGGANDPVWGTWPMSGSQV